MTASRAPLVRLDRLAHLIRTRQLPSIGFPRRMYSSSSSSIDAYKLRQSMLSRHEQQTYDILTPVPTHLLASALSDFLPASSFPEPFNDPSFLSHYSSGSLTEETLQKQLILPESHHLVHFPLALPPSQLCPDGTDPYHSPGSPFERRMWAGGSITFGRPFPIKQQRVVCRERIADVWVRGREGEEKVFVDVERKYDDPEERESQGLDDPPVIERRTLVFMKERTAAEAASDAIKGRDGRIVRAPHTPTFSHTLTPTRTLLSQYSALSYNAHQIHLNPQYCREVEGHRDLLVHGPLTLTLMLSVLRSQLRAGQRIALVEYRNLAPLYVGEPLTVCMRQVAVEMVEGVGPKRQQWDVWVEDKNGGLSVRATVKGDVKDFPS